MLLTAEGASAGAALPLTLGVCKCNLASGETTAVLGDVSEAPAVAARRLLVALAGVVKRNLPKGVAGGQFGDLWLSFAFELRVSSYQASRAC